MVRGLPRRAGRSLRLAYDSPGTKWYRDLGRVLVGRDGPAIIGHLQLGAGDSADAAELKSIAVREEPGHGVGRMLLERAIATCRDEARSELLVATAAADVGCCASISGAGFDCCASSAT